MLLFQNVWNRKCTKITSMILMNMKFHFSFGYHHSTYQAWNLFVDTHNMTFQYSFVSLDFTTVRTYHRSVRNNNFQDKIKKNYKECLDLGHCVRTYLWSWTSCMWLDKLETMAPHWLQTLSLFTGGWGAFGALRSRDFLFGLCMSFKWLSASSLESKVISQKPHLYFHMP